MKDDSCYSFNSHLDYRKIGKILPYFYPKKTKKTKNMSVKSICDLEDSQKFMIKNKWSMFASRDVCIYFGKKTWSNSFLSES